MKKIRLDLDELSVETFSAEAGPPPCRGTVAANEDTEYTCQNTPKTCYDFNSGCWCLPDYYTDAADNTCGQSCQDGCFSRYC